MLFKILVYILLILLVISYSKARSILNFFKIRNIPHIKPWFIFGNVAEFVFQRKAFHYVLDGVYKQFNNERYYGFYQFMTPMLAIKDPEIIKQITIKEFDSFVNHREMVPSEVDPLWNKTLFGSADKYWRHLRITISPTFTSSKMKMMFSLMKECAKEFVKFYKNSDEDVIDIELKNTFCRFTTDVIVNTSLGVQCNSLTEQNNIFYKMGQRVARLMDGSRGFVMFLSALSPTLMKVLNIPIVEKDVSDFFRSLIGSNLKERRYNGYIRNDIIQLLLQAQQGKLRDDGDQDDSGFAAAKEYLKNDKEDLPPITDEDIVAQAIVFFLGGLDTTSILLACLGYELTVNPDIQARLREEIDQKHEECKNNVQYSDILSMKYMDMVVTESLRKYPQAFFLERICNKDYTIEAVNPNEQDITIKSGESIMIPVYGIQHDPKNYPNPEIFDPERFSDENKHLIKPYTFLPFGVGPRNCIGSRFALLSTKVIIYYTLLNFYLVPTEKTPKVFVIDPKKLNYTPIGGFWSALKKRE